PTTPTLSAFARALTSMAAARSPSATAWSISRTIAISGSIARVTSGRRSRIRLHQPAPPRTRCGMRMASSTAAGAHGLRPGGSHTARRGDHDAGRRQPLRRDGSPDSRLGERLLFDAPSQSRRKPNVLADLAPSRYAMGGDAGLGRGRFPGRDESVFQPEWSPDGDLYFVSDRGSGWWNLYRGRDGAIEPVTERNAEFGRPQWQFGMSTYAFESADRLVACFVRDGVWTLAAIDTRSRRLEVVPTEFTDIAQLRAAAGRVVFI